MHTARQPNGSRTSGAAEPASLAPPPLCPNAILSAPLCLCAHTYCRSIPKLRCWHNVSFRARRGVCAGRRWRGGRCTHVHTHTYTHTHTHTHTHTAMHTHTHTHTYIRTYIHKDRQTDRQTDRQVLPGKQGASQSSMTLPTTQRPRHTEAGIDLPVAGTLRLCVCVCLCVCVHTG